MVVAVANTTNNDYVSFETQETVAYKVIPIKNYNLKIFKTKYALKKGLAGVGFTNLNQEDFEGVCSKGLFPLLSAVNRARDCTVTDEKNNAKTSNNREFNNKFKN